MSTTTQKSKLIRDTLKIGVFNEEFCSEKYRSSMANIHKEMNDFSVLFNQLMKKNKK
jgi:hypothetical protein